MNKVCDIIGKSPKSPNDWTYAFISMKTFLLSDVHISSSVKQLFQKDELSKEENKLGTKIVLWFIDKEIEKQAQSLVQKNLLKMLTSLKFLRHYLQQQKQN